MIFQQMCLKHFLLFTSLHLLTKSRMHIWQHFTLFSDKELLLLNTISYFMFSNPGVGKM